MSNDYNDYRDPLFKGATRPAMMMGVPVVPLFIIGMGVVLISVWTSIFLVLLLVPIIVTMQQITKHDDQQFRLLGLKFVFRIINYNHNGRFYKSSAYSPFDFEKRKK
jgi:type IV secretion system protein VirB3